MQTEQKGYAMHCRPPPVSAFAGNTICSFLGLLLDIFHVNTPLHVYDLEWEYSTCIVLFLAFSLNNIFWRSFCIATMVSSFF